MSSLLRHLWSLDERYIRHGHLAIESSRTAPLLRSFCRPEPDHMTAIPLHRGLPETLVHRNVRSGLDEWRRGDEVLAGHIRIACQS